MTNDAGDNTQGIIPLVIGQPEIGPELMERGIGRGHFLFNLIRKVYLDGADITPLGVVFVSPADRLAVVAREAPGDRIQVIDGVPVTRQLGGKIELEIGNALMSQSAIDELIESFPEVRGYLRVAPEAEAPE